MTGLRNPLHGRDHSPKGKDPIATGPWHYVGGSGEPTFESGENMPATADIPDPTPLRFRVAVGSLNRLNAAGDTIVQYKDKELDIEGDVMGMADGDTVFTLPLAYRNPYDVPIQAHDDNQNYIAGRVFSDGRVVLGVA